MDGGGSRAARHPALAVLVILAFRKSRVAIMGGRDRALRSACLVAALLVPVHGIFDVPGHHITLAWSAALLFALSLRSSGDAGAPRPAPRAWPFRLAALALLATSAYLIRAEWWGGPQLALTSAKVALTEAHRLYQEDQARQAAVGSGVHQPEPAADPLEKALALLEQAGKITPLDREIRRYQGFLALHFEGQDAVVRKAFEIERALDPTWVKAPLQQALAWSNADPEETVRLWGEALRRARWLDQRHPGSQWSETATCTRIREQVRGKLPMEQLWKARFGE